MSISPITRPSYILFFILLNVSIAFAQASFQGCPSTDEYVDCNKADPPSLAIRVVTGRIAEKSDGQEQKAKPVKGACISLFTENEHKLIASTITDEKGYFIFGAIKPGAYRLVAYDPQNTSSTANGRIRVYPKGRGPVPKGIGLVIFLRPAIDGCGTVTRE